MTRALPLLLAIALLGCEKRKPGEWSCSESVPAQIVTFPDGSIKHCHKLQCDPYCLEWVCRDQATELTCRPTSSEESK